MNEGAFGSPSVSDDVLRKQLGAALQMIALGWGGVVEV